MSYVVYINDPVSKARVHIASCPHYLTREGDKTKHGYWKPFETFEQAWSYANQTGKVHITKCKKCIK